MSNVIKLTSQSKWVIFQRKTENVSKGEGKHTIQRAIINQNYLSKSDRAGLGQNTGGEYTNMVIYKKDFLTSKWLKM